VRWDPTTYDGTAVHYRYGRPAYSPVLEALLAEELGLDGSGRLLDAGCGPGILTVRLARLFEEAVGLDPDPEMIAEGRRAARAKAPRRRSEPAVTAKTPLPAPALACRG
jgi:SAM-dependent methyltransferase